MPAACHSLAPAILNEKYGHYNSSNEENGLQVRKLVLLITDSQIVLALINFFLSFLL